MTDQELHELGDWIATKGLGWERQGDVWITEPGGTVMYFPEIASWSPWTNPSDFAEIKREIERRGWSWEAQYISRARMDIRYRFTVFTENWESDGCVNASTEELAGCLAFKAAVEATDGKDTD